MQCPHCSALFHEDHYFEWTKTENHCPICNEKLKIIKRPRRKNKDSFNVKNDDDGHRNKKIKNKYNKTWPDPTGYIYCLMYLIPLCLTGLILQVMEDATKYLSLGWTFFILSLVTFSMLMVINYRYYGIFAMKWKVIEFQEEGLEIKGTFKSEKIFLTISDISEIKISKSKPKHGDKRREINLYMIIKDNDDKSYNFLKIQQGSYSKVKAFTENLISYVHQRYGFEIAFDDLYFQKKRKLRVILLTILNILFGILVILALVFSFLSISIPH